MNAASKARCARVCGTEIAIDVVRGLQEELDGRCDLLPHTEETSVSSHIVKERMKSYVGRGERIASFDFAASSISACNSWS